MLSISQEVNTGEVSELIDLSEVNATQLGQLAINDITAVKDIFLLDSSCKYGWPETYALSHNHAWPFNS